MFQEELRIFSKSCQSKGRFEAFTYKSILATIFRNRGLPVESKDNTMVSQASGMGDWLIKLLGQKYDFFSSFGMVSICL